MERWQNERKTFFSESIQSQTAVSILRRRDRPAHSNPILGSLYFFHGGGADDRQLIHFGAMDLVQGRLLDRFTELGLQVVFPYIGKDFLRDSREGEAISHSRYFLKEILPIAEEGTQTTAQSRWLAGLSMGGHAALNMFLRNSLLFQGAAAHFPTLVNFNYHSESEAQAFAERNRVGDDFLKTLLADLKEAFPEVSEFKKHDPITLASEINPALLQGKPLYFDVGTEDQFGLQEGAQALHGILEERKVPHGFDLVQGGKHDGPFVATHLCKLLEHLLSEENAKKSGSEASRFPLEDEAPSRD